jgi:alkanesulfonate monooxygenase SsuD/methylene tetrahydromethanopterin reductase-like flavin-dependent oxidoreductase (luciferase family)
MATSSVVDAARRALGPVGVSMPVTFTSTALVDERRAAVRRLERVGYRTAWTNEVIGKDALAQLAVLLAATERMAFGTCVANIWARLPQTAHGAAADLAQAYPDRFTLGLGVGYPQQAESVGREFGSPLATMRDYVTGMDGQTWPPAPDTAYPRGERAEDARAGRRDRRRRAARRAAAGAHRAGQAAARPGQAARGGPARGGG